MLAQLLPCPHRVSRDRLRDRQPLALRRQQSQRQAGPAAQLHDDARAGNGQYIARLADDADRVHAGTAQIEDLRQIEAVLNGPGD
jgi:hypothetical protein